MIKYSGIYIANRQVANIGLLHCISEDDDMETQTQPKKETGVCEKCGKQFKSKSGLNDHERRHGENPRAPYKCCGKVFFSRANLTRHR